METPPRYLSGFGNEFETEALPGALPLGQNSPQSCAYGLFASSFPAQASRRRAPSISAPGSIASVHRCCTRETFRLRRLSVEDRARPARRGGELGTIPLEPGPHSKRELTFVAGVRTITTAGDVDMRSGMSANIYFVTQSMADEYFYDADGELLVVPQQGALSFFTEFGLSTLLLAKSAFCRAASNSRWRLLMAPREAFCARIMAPPSPCLIAALLALIASPMRAISKRRPPPSRTTKTRRDDGQMGRKILSLRDRPFAA